MSKGPIALCGTCPQPSVAVLRGPYSMLRPATDPLRHISEQGLSAPSTWCRSGNT